MRAVGKVRQHLQEFLVCHGRIHLGKKGWTVACRRRLTTVHFVHPAQRIVVQDHLHAVSNSEVRVERLTRQSGALLLSWSLVPTVRCLPAACHIAPTFLALP